VYESPQYRLVDARLAADFGPRFAGFRYRLVHRFKNHVPTLPSALQIVKREFRRILRFSFRVVPNPAAQFIGAVPNRASDTYDRDKAGLRVGRQGPLRYAQELRSLPRRQEQGGNVLLFGLLKHAFTPSIARRFFSAGDLVCDAEDSFLSFF
jgi:hypothetical protein